MSQVNQRIKAVFFDFDGVLTTDSSGNETMARSLSRSTGIAEEEILRALAPHMNDLVLGRKVHADVLTDICASIGASITNSMLLEAFRAAPLNLPMLDLARSFGESVRVGIITDNPRDRIHHIVRIHHLERFFSPIVVSADIGHSKRTPEIFEHSLRQASAISSEALFIDNTERNLVVAKSIGMHVIHHDDAANDVRKLEASLAASYGLLSGVAT